ncbi:hypothetical protein H6G65_05700 [Microcystis elabens FACHB-917]|nr:hypothetical protein [Microcystis elabens FACHB-917]
MAIPTTAELLGALLAGLVPLGGWPALAQSASPSQPLIIDSRPGLAPPPCPLVVPRRDVLLQPLRIHPSQVPQKNSIGCLSAADALYGPDGCPRQLCGQQRGFQVPLPAPGQL